MEWSKIMQPPEFLAATRIALFQDEFAPGVVRHCGIETGMKVLEVGCGTGCFSRWLSKETKEVSYTGLDRDEEFLRHAIEVYESNTISYVLASAFHMPFEDNSFDAVISHTFFNCVEHPKLAMKEMKRVVKAKGRITSITSMSLGCETWHAGYYPTECGWNETIRKFQSRMLKILEKQGLGVYSMSKGYPASIMPRFFSYAGLKQVHIHPVSRAFSLSNGAMQKETKEEYIRLLTIGEKKRLWGAKEVPGFVQEASEEACIAYETALDERERFYLTHLEDNSIWEWFGSSALLVSGIRI